MRTRIPALGSNGEGWLVLQLLLFAAIAVSGRAALDASNPGSMPAAIAVGATLIACGGLVAIWSVRELGSALSPLPRPNAQSHLVDSGPYSRVRHPIYTGLIVAGIGWSILSWSWLSLVFSIALAVLFDLKSRREEEWLQQRHPDYAAYRARTRRFVPWIY